MKPFTELTIAEIVALTPDQIAKYAVEVGDTMLDDIAFRQEVARKLGTGKILSVQKKAIAIHKDLTG